MKTLVIGSYSFSGQDFVRHALDCGDQVIGISRSKQKQQYNLSYDKNNPNFDFLQLDLNKDTDMHKELNRRIAKCNAILNRMQIMEKLP